ncbi:MAG TPA: nucleotidyltransferase domain-containing protein [Actinophytocola sp.]|uniref:nucleotidyltransferase domain-containing protein n=1 Tax=Actinophytocola sp. TaxID=1872138 RepID=UPI002DBA5918|nr:nucleotidyltransferase domain-containing protein [Actinophytocola sp.]HEU5470430.1 nucleotidyltransferase domain-containing protein [Actinophytocola sp.]
MHQHHEESIRRIVEYFEPQPDVLGLLLAGSLAHGFAGPDSDVDVLILVTEEEHARRVATGQRTFVTADLCTYPGGYVDGKYLRPGFLAEVAARGSEPARFAFADARVLFGRLDGLPESVRAAARYPEEGRIERMRRFHAQLQAWHWYANEALRRNNRYLLGLAVSKLVLFGGRLILAHNRALYPYHKWFLEVLGRVEERPPGLFDLIGRLHEEPSEKSVTEFYEAVRNFRDWPPLVAGWGGQFMIDSELNWLTGAAPVDDL